MTSEELSEKLIVAEDALAELSENELETLLQEIGYSAPAIALLKDYQSFVKAFREKVGLL